MTFKQAKAVIRGALAEATDAKLIEILEAARAGKMAFFNCEVCLAGRLFEDLSRDRVPYVIQSDAYGYVGFPDCNTPISEITPEAADSTRQRILVPMVLSEIRRRLRARDIDDAETVSTIEELFVGVRC